MDAQTVKLHPSVLLTPTWKGPYLASSLLNTPSPDGYLLPVSLRLLLRLCCLDNLCPLLCLHYDSGSLFSDKLLARVDRQFVDYRDLAERHLGTIYEGLLEFHLEKAAPSDHGWTIDLKTEKGERKATGSYYTPDYIV
ncbi:MAG TPA: hypothetical protein VK667_06470, partial [Ktedonobacteraceae bacterium]|nr:hypothetical protein [Ktedonobacteraceae bacterium]